MDITMFGFSKPLPTSVLLSPFISDQIYYDKK